MNSDIVILTVIPPELAAVRASLGLKDIPTKLASGTSVWTGSVRSSKYSRNYRVALGCIGMAGNPDAAASAAEMLMNFNPRIAILSGIAAGIRGKLRIGQVVLSERVVAYEPAAWEPERVVQRPESVRTDRTVEQDVAAYLSSISKSRLQRLFQAKLAHLVPAAPKGREEEYDLHVAKGLEIVASTIASGEKLLRDPSRLLAMREIHGKVEVGEMEANGFMVACRQQGVPWLVVRGISDFGDTLKDDKFHQFASGTAAVTLLDFIRNGLNLPDPEEDEKAATKRLAKAESRYRQLALEACDIVDLAGLPEDTQVAKQDLVLRELYIPLRVKIDDVEERPVEADSDVEAPKDPLRATLAKLARKSEGRVSVGHLLRTTRRVVVLADPGGGKSTLLRWLATAYLLRLKKDPALSRLPDLATLPEEDYLPIVIRCRDLDEACVGGTLDDMLQRTLRKSELSADESEALGELLRKRLDEGTALLLVDGLDEIPSSAARGAFCKQLERIVLAYPRSPVVVTSRIVGYREMGFRLGREFVHSQITDLTDNDKNNFAKRWCALTEPADRRSKKIEELIEGIHGSDRIERLTGNPMMLTTLALVKRKVGRLPHRRAELYQEAVQVLLHWRADVDVPLEKTEALPQLEYVAWEMCRRGVQRLGEPEVIELLERIREDFTNIRPIRNHSPEEFLRVLERRTSILVQMGTTRRDGELVPVYEFRHLTFQEYLAGVALVRSRYPGRERPKTLADRVGPLAGEAVASAATRVHLNARTEVGENWTEAIRLCVASCNDDDVDDVLRAIATPSPAEDPNVVARGRAILAALCLADEPNVSDVVAREVLSRFVSEVKSGDGEGPVRTSLDDAAMQLATSFWSGLLQELLLKQFLSDTPDIRLQLGGLFSMMSRGGPNADVRAVDGKWLERQVPLLCSEDRSTSVGTALCVMDYFYHNVTRPDVPEGMVDSLIRLLSGDRWQQYAASWALMWVFPSRRRLKGGSLKLSAEQRERLASAMAPNLSGAQFLSLVVTDDWDPQFEGRLQAWLRHASSEARERSAFALSRCGGRESLGALQQALFDPEPGVRRAAAKGVIVIAGASEGVRTVLSPELKSGDEAVADPKFALTEDRIVLAAGQANLSVDQVRDELRALGFFDHPTPASEG